MSIRSRQDCDIAAPIVGRERSAARCEDFFGRRLAQVEHPARCTSLEQMTDQIAIAANFQRMFVAPEPSAVEQERRRVLLGPFAAVAIRTSGNFKAKIAWHQAIKMGV